MTLVPVQFKSSALNLALLGFYFFSVASLAKAEQIRGKIMIVFSQIQRKLFLQLGGIHI